jgi:hypothetical protein
VHLKGLALGRNNSIARLTRLQATEIRKEILASRLKPSYRGLENGLYRVEIHDARPVGETTFKWSRDNA